ncbi:Target SNARE coiled-coil homology domain [Dillenia turbinata]|uniref:Target SNARE coiled-coil homology domain n=1 Tax=Dillenia turbinata TaxID=194707 RepID=A0AAN8VUJ6_9MAGN
MSVIQILTRVDVICKKYDKYGIDKQRELNAFGSDDFSSLYASVESSIEQALHKSEVAAAEKNRAASAALNAEVRRTKARLLDEIPKLQKLAHKKVKGISREDLAARIDLVLPLSERIKAIPDGTLAAAGGGGGWSVSGINDEIKFNSLDGRFDGEFFQQSEESSMFRNEYEMRRMKQASDRLNYDEGLDIISDGLNTLKNLAQDMNEELDRQVPLVDEIDTKVDKASSDLKNTNVRLKQTLNEVRSSRNFCIDIILLCIILGLGSYLYNLKLHMRIVKSLSALGEGTVMA